MMFISLSFCFLFVFSDCVFIAVCTGQNRYVSVLLTCASDSGFMWHLFEAKVFD